jgi:dihydropyrimidinase
MTEAESVQRACFLAKHAACPLYLVHVSAKESLDEIRQAKLIAKQPVHTETCMHYLIFSKEEGNQLEGAVVKVIPPLRDKESVEALWQAIDNQEIDTLGTDHIALSRSRKLQAWQADPGFPGVETLLPLVLTEAQKRQISFQKIARLCSYNPARIFGLYPQKGTLKPTADADIVVVNMNKPHRIKADRLHSNADFTPYEDIEVSAEVEATWLRGNLLFQHDGTLTARRGKSLFR